MRALFGVELKGPPCSSLQLQTGQLIYLPLYNEEAEYVLHQEILVPYDASEKGAWSL